MEKDIFSWIDPDDPLNQDLSDTEENDPEANQEIIEIINYLETNQCTPEELEQKRNSEELKQFIKQWRLLNNIQDRIKKLQKFGKLGEN